MKKILLACLMVLLWSSVVMAAGSACVVTYDNSVPMSSVTFTCTGDDANGTFPNTTTVPIRGWIILAETNPGSTGPTNAYDIVLNTASGVDVMGGSMGDRSSTATERAVPAVSGWIDGTLTQVVTNASVNSATFTNTIIYWRQE